MTDIEWVRNPDGTKGESWNPVVGCTHVSEGCDHCYAAREASGRLKNTPTYRGLAKDGKFTGEIRLLPERLEQPLRKQKPTTWFVNSMSDLFHKDVPDDFIAQVFAVMGIAGRHTFQVLTKRPGRMASLLSSERFHKEWFRARHERASQDDVQRMWGRNEAGIAADWPPRNVWLGTSVENQKWADVRIPHLLRTPAAIRFLSCEPLLGPVTFLGTTNWLRALDWIIVGGESGPDARPMHPGWVRQLQGESVKAGVPFFLKQWGEWAPFEGWLHELPRSTKVTLFSDGTRVCRVGKRKAGRELDGRTWDEMPELVRT